MTEIDSLIAQAEHEMRRATSATTQADRDRCVMQSERLLDQAWQLNELDASLPALVSGLWANAAEKLARAA